MKLTEAQKKRRRRCPARARAKAFKIPSLAEQETLVSLLLCQERKAAQRYRTRNYITSNRVWGMKLRYYPSHASISQVRVQLYHLERGPKYDKLVKRRWLPGNDWSLTKRGQRVAEAIYQMHRALGLLP
jgi:hypothetical protein